MRKLLTSVVVLTVLLLVVDRVGAYAAGKVMAGKLRSSAGLTSDPTVHIDGFPFLTQVASGRYDRVELDASDVSRGGVRLHRVQTSLVGARIPPRDAASGSVTSVPVESVSARVVVTYADVMARSNGQSAATGLTIQPDGDKVKVTGRLTVLGQDLTASTTSTVTLRGSTLILTGHSISVAGRKNAALDAAFGGRLDLQVPVGRLPFGLTLTGVTVDPSGLVITAHSGPTVLHTLAMGSG